MAAPSRGRRAAAVAAVLAGALALLAACAYPIRNEPLAALDEESGYRWAPRSEDSLPETLLVVTASGGGTRATALALATLEGLHALKLANGRSLAEEVDIISSVSGGSVTAGWFALTGVQGFAALDRDFVRADGIAALLAEGLNPMGLARLAMPGTERIDLLIDYFNQQLFDEATFQALVDRPDAPFLILNAADMVAGTVFPFTQDTFDLLCSDLARLDLATGVAASAAFPVALSPVTLTNYSRCAAQGAWIPGWVEEATENTDWYDNPTRVQRGRAALGYVGGAEGIAPTPYIHLLDGGIADNLGLSEPIRMMTTNEVEPPLLQDIVNGNITRIVFVVVNSSSDPDSDLGAEAATPGIVDMLLGTIDAAIGNATSGTQERIRAVLGQRFAAEAERLPAPLADNLKRIAESTYLLEIDFDAIEDADCRRRFKNITTSWTLPGGQIDALLAVGPALLAQAQDYPAMLAEVGAVAQPMPSMDEACAKLDPEEE